MENKNAIRLLLCLFCLIPSLAPCQSYSITDLGTLYPNAINIWAQVVGEENHHAFLWTSLGGARDLGILPGGTFSTAAGISDLGVITGTADGFGIAKWRPNIKCKDLTQPFIWTPTDGMRGLGTVGLIGGISYFACHIAFYATGINAFGNMIGYHPEVDTYEDGFLWTKAGGMTVRYFGYANATNAINNNGEIVGDYLLPLLDLSLMSHAMVLNGQTLTDLGTLGGPDPNWLNCSSGNGLNDLGQVVGWSTSVEMTFPCSAVLTGEDFPHAFLWTATSGMQDLGTLTGDSASAASKINLLGEVIGSSGSALVSVQGGPLGGELIQVIGRPFIWSERKGMQDLNTLIPVGSGWVLNSVADINIWGQIVGSGTFNGEAHGFLLTHSPPK